MLDIICSRKEKTRVFLYFNFYKMMLNIFKSERTCGARELPNLALSRKSLDTAALQRFFVPTGY